MKHLLENELENEAYEIIGSCMEVHRNPGHGFSEVVRQLTKSHYAQVINYLAVSDLPLGL